VATLDADRWRTHNPRTNTFLQKFCTFNIEAGRQDNSSEAESVRFKLRVFRKCSMNVYDNSVKKISSLAKIPTVWQVLTSLNTKQNRMDKYEFPLWLKLSYDHNHGQHRAQV
jgi:hypothetical protein